MQGSITMWLVNTTSALKNTSHIVSLILHSVADGVLALMMFLTAFDVILRYLFRSPILGSFELTEYMMTIVVAFGIAYCYVLRRHVVVDIIVSRASPRAQAITDFITGIVSLVLFCLIAWQSGLQTIIEFNSKLVSAVLLIPVYPFVAVVAFGSAVMAFVILVFCIESLARAVGVWK